MRQLAALLIVIGLLLLGCSGMTVGVGLYDDNAYLRPSYNDYYDNYFGFDHYASCPRHFYNGPLDCRSCHFFY